MNNILKYSLVLFLLLLVQTTLFNHIIIGHGIIIFVYVLIILILPLKTPGWALLLISFLTGLAMDSIFNSGGIHAFSTVLTAFVRPLFLKILTNPYDLELAFSPGIRSLGFLNFLKYSSILIFIHNFSVAFLEVFNFSNFFFNLLIVLINSTLTLLICLMLEALFRKEKTRSL